MAEPNYPYPLPPETTLAIRFIENENMPIIPAYEALHVSNFVTSVGLPFPDETDFLTACDDPSNFRIEVYDPDTEPPVRVIMEVGNRPLITVDLKHRFGPWWRSDFLRLVSDQADADVRPEQTVLCKLGEAVGILWKRVDETGEVQTSIDIGRPTSGENNEDNQRRHDIRELKLNVIVFSQPGVGTLKADITANQLTIKTDATTIGIVRPSGTMRIDNELIEYASIDDTTNEFKNCTRGAQGTLAAAHTDGTDIKISQRFPSVGKTSVEGDLAVVDQRFAQATTRLRSETPIDMGGEGEFGRALPGKMLDGVTLSGLDEIEDFTDDELAMIALKDGDVNSIDVFYMANFSAPGTDDETKAAAYPVIVNKSGDLSRQNFIIVKSSRGDLTLPHEIMHILLNAAHRLNPDDPVTALFNRIQREFAKRIGPYPAAAASVGNNDTYVIRPRVESLPQL